MKEKRKKNRGFFRALLIFALIVIAILAVTLAVRSGREGGIRAMWLSLFPRNGVREFFYENAANGAFSELDGGIAVASGSGLYVYDETGEMAWSRLFTWNAPAVTGEGDYRAAYDIGGNLVIFFTADRSITEITTEHPVVSASVNSLGYLAVCTEAEGYFGVVTVYNSLGKAIYRWSAGSARVLSARVSGRSTLVALTVGRGGSRLVSMALESEALNAEYTYPGLLIDFTYTDSGLTAVGTSCVIGLSDGLEERWSYDYEGRFLRDYRIGSEGCVLDLSPFQVGGGRTFVTLGADGDVLGTAAEDTQADTMDLRGKKLAVLSGDDLTLYDLSLNELEKYTCDTGASTVLLREDGTVLAAGSFSAYVYGGDE